MRGGFFVRLVLELSMYDAPTRNEFLVILALGPTSLEPAMKCWH